MRAYSFSLLRINKMEAGHGFKLTQPPQWKRSDNCPAGTLVGDASRNRWVHAKYVLYGRNPKHPHDDGACPVPCLAGAMPVNYYAIQDSTWVDRPIYTVHLYTIGRCTEDDPTRQLTWGVAWRRYKVGRLYRAELSQHFWNEKQARAFYTNITDRSALAEVIAASGQV